jgi:CheY-like chemotaxis protein
MPVERPNLNNPQSVFNAGYEAAIKRAVPEPFLKRAAEIVQSRKPKDPRLQDLDVLGMAKVLVVEDEKSWERTHKMIAEEAGHEVVIATSAEEAKKALEANGIDRIVTDGLEDAWTQVHDIAQEKGIKIVVVSASNTVKTEAKKRGVQYVDKGDVDHIFDNLTDVYERMNRKSSS